MIITSAKSTSQTKNLQPNQIIPKVAKYLYKSIDSAYDLKLSVNTADVFISVLYQLPVYNEAQHQPYNIRKKDKDEYHRDCSGRKDARI